MLTQTYLYYISRRMSKKWYSPVEESARSEEHKDSPEARIAITATFQRWSDEEEQDGLSTNVQLFISWNYLCNNLIKLVVFTSSKCSCYTKIWIFLSRIVYALYISKMSQGKCLELKKWKIFIGWSTNIETALNAYSLSSSKSSQSQHELA